MSNINWGVIGFGIFTDNHMGPAIAGTKGHTLLALMGRSLNRVKIFAAKYKVKHYYDSVRKLIDNPDLDAVYVVTPNNQHHQHTILAAERGLHVLCEKPMAAKIEDAEDMLKVCNKYNVKLMIGNMMRFHPCHQWARDQIKKGILGEISEARAVFEYYLPQHSTNWRLEPMKSGGGAIVDIGIHCIDLLRYILGSEVTHVASFINTNSNPFPVDYNSAIILKFNTGAHGSITVSFNNKLPVNTLEFRGNDGYMILEGTLWRVPTGRVNVTTQRGTYVFESAENNQDPFVCQIQHFAECIKADKKPMVDGEEGLKDLKVCFAAYESAQKGFTVRVD
jgi:predicted dehydrogenase